MSANRAKQTGPELKMKRLLIAAGLKGFKLNDKRLPGKPDFVYRKERVAVFVNGCFWHGHRTHEWPEVKTNMEYWRGKIGRNQERDARKSSELESIGWKALTVWECELEKDSASSVTRVAEALGRRR
jgi:DNA mismatch endonuclease, patch repair protein